MKTALNKAYKNLCDAIDGFANCTVPQNTNKEPEAGNTVKPSAPVLDYAYPCNNYINTILSNKWACQALRKLADNYYSDQIGEIVGNSICLTKANFPKLWSNYEYCCNKLSVVARPSVYITTKLSGINALSVEYSGKQMILLSFKAAVMNKDAEQRFLLGHELGHIQLGHLAAHVVQGLLTSLNKKNELLGPMVSDMFEVELNGWYRTSEFTADRAGYLCCGEMDAIKSLLGNIFEHKLRVGYYGYMELYKDHPFVKTRIAVLEQFEESNKYV